MLAAFFCFYMLTFWNFHGYNHGLDSVFLRNRILSYVTLTPLLKIVGFLPICLALCSLIVTKLQRPWNVVLYSATVLYLLPSLLIEQRYYFVPLVLFILLREPEKRNVEWIQTFYQLIMTSVIFWIVASRWLFL